MKPLLLCLVLFVMSLSAHARGLPRAESCGSCHVYNFDTWEKSAHANSINSKNFRSCLNNYLEKEKTGNGTYCFECHAPGEVISGNTFAVTNDILKGKKHRDGITCVACHSVESIENGKAVYDPGDIHGYHRVKDLKSINREALCSTCHNSYQSTQAAKEKTEPDFMQEIYMSLGGLVSTRHKTKTDHTFPQSQVTNKKHWDCPDPSLSKPASTLPQSEGQH